MNTYILLYLYFQVIIFISAFIWCCERIIRKKTIIKIRNKVSRWKSPSEMEQYRLEQERKINFLLKGALFALLFWCNLYLTVPAIKDIPYVFTRNYSTIQGVTDSTDKTGNDTIRMRSFMVKSGGRRIEIHAMNDYIEMDKYVKVIYLPHTHYGTIMEEE